MPTHEITIRRATPADWETIVEYNRRLAEETEDTFLDLGVLTAGVRAALADSGKALYFVAESEDEIVGQAMITFEWSDWRNGFIWWFQSVYVRADWRRQGIFQRLYAQILEAGREAGAVGFRLYVVAENAPALAAYAKHGMETSPYIVLERFPEEK